MKTTYSIEPARPRKSREELEAEIAAYQRAGGKVQEVNKGETTLHGMPVLRPKVRPQSTR